MAASEAARCFKQRSQIWVEDEAMSLLAQHGWGKSNKIERGIETGTLSGVILSPRDESPPNLSAYVEALRRNDPNLTVMVDPQFYATTVTNIASNLDDSIAPFVEPLWCIP